MEEALLNSKTQNMSQKKGVLDRWIKKTKFEELQHKNINLEMKIQSTKTN